MRRSPRMAGEGFDSAEADGVAADLETSQKVKCRESPSLQFERKKRPRIISLPIANPDLLGIRKQRGIEDSFDFLISRQLLGDALCVLTLAIHPQAHR